MNFVGVVFDLDGVLADTEHLWEESWSDFSRRHGYGWTADDTAQVQGMSAPEWARYVSELTGTEADVAERECVDYMVHALKTGRAQPLPGADELVGSTAKLVPIALASSAARRVIDAFLSAFNMNRYFAATVSSAEVPRGKPSPDVYAEAVRRLRIDPAHGLAVEDSGNGIRAAHAAGLTVIAIPNPTYPPRPDALRLAHRIARSPEEARGVLHTLIDPPDNTEPP